MYTYIYACTDVTLYTGLAVKAGYTLGFTDNFFENFISKVTW